MANQQKRVQLTRNCLVQLWCMIVHNNRTRQFLVALIFADPYYNNSHGIPSGIYNGSFLEMKGLHISKIAV